MAKRRHFSAEFKASVVLAVISGAKTAAEICREHTLKPQLLSAWKTQFLQDAATIFAADHSRDDHQVRIDELERLLGQKMLELEIAKKASTLLHSQASRNGRL